MDDDRYLLDTCLILGLYQQSEAAINLLNAHQVRLKQGVISVISRIEVLGFSQLTLIDEHNLTFLLQ